ncbi:MAG: IS1595 family transposase [Saprospiraceae bacterium]|nr:IS1595 family transposase [Saprospiraceae bacterium]
MIPLEFSKFFNDCDNAHKQMIIDELIDIVMQNECVPDNVDGTILKCPHCSSMTFRRNGYLKKMKRFKCNKCNKHFSQSTGKFWFALKKKNLLSTYMYCLISGYSIRKSAQFTGISIQTSFDWRHKLLTSFSTVLPVGFKGIVEVNGLDVQYSEKGNRSTGETQSELSTEIKKKADDNKQVAVLATCDRGGREYLRVITQGSLRLEDVKRALQGRIQYAEILISGRENKLDVLNRDLEIEQLKPESEKSILSNPTIHIKNVNNMTIGLTKFMIPFHGVATKYLQNYLNWFLILTKVKDVTRKILTAASIALSANRTWFDFRDRNINIFFRT